MPVPNYAEVPVPAPYLYPEKKTRPAVAQPVISAVICGGPSHLRPRSGEAAGENSQTRLPLAVHA